MICDAGGETVVRPPFHPHSDMAQDLISYKVVRKSPFVIEEVGVGIGAACGAVYLDQEFEKLLKLRFGEAAEKVLTAKRITDLKHYFETAIKRQFNPLNSSADTDFEIPIAGVRDMLSLGFKDGYLTLRWFVLQ